MNPTHPSPQKQSSAKPSAQAHRSASTHPPVRQRDKNEYAITIGREPQEVFAFWRNLPNLARFMKDLESVTQKSEKESHWVVRLKSDVKVEWDAVITKEEPGRMIAWKSVEGSQVETQGAVWFEPAPQGLGTVVSLSVEYSVPGGKLGEFVASFTAEDPKHLILTNLVRLRALLETGEIPTTEGQPSGREEKKLAH